MKTREESYKKWMKENAFLLPSAQDAFYAGWEAHCVSDCSDGPEPVLGAETITPEMIYQAYPRKVGKADALKAIVAAMHKRGCPTMGYSSPAEYMLSCVKQYAAAVAKWPKDEQRFVPHPATWFNRGSYDDDPKEWVRQPVSGSRITNASQIRTLN